MLHFYSTQHQCGPFLSQGVYLRLNTGHTPWKMGHAGHDPQYPLSPKAVEGVIIPLIPLLLLVRTSWSPGEAERMLKRTQSCRRCSLIPEPMGPTKHFPSDKTSDATCFHSPWQSPGHVLEALELQRWGQGTGDALSPLCTAL